MSTLPRRESRRIANTSRILKAAESVFSQSGYSATSMDAIAAECGLSKPTLYQYFENKERLFTEMMLARRDHMLLSFECADSVGMVEQLFRFAWSYADTVMTPEFLSLARLIIGESQRFPEIGHAYQQAGPDKVLKGVMGFLDVCRRDGLLEFEDAELAAQDLWGLILSAPRNQALHMPDNLPNRAELSRYINNGLHVFLRAYSTQVTVHVGQLEELKNPIPEQLQRVGTT